MRPSRLMLLMEGRAVLDGLSMIPMFAMHRYFPTGDGHPVLVLPGFLASSRSTIPLRRFLQRVGYQAHRWKLGVNLGYSEDLHDAMRHRMVELTDRYDQRISLVGWSLGGIYARELARDHPDLVRQVITLGSPFNGTPHNSNIALLFRFFSKTRYEDMPRELLEQLATAPQVPTTAIYTRGDGVVSWQTTVDPTLRDDVQNVHVGGPHIGLGYNPRALWVICNRLAQPDGDWQRFAATGLEQRLLKSWFPNWLVGADLVQDEQPDVIVNASLQ